MVGKMYEARKKSVDEHTGNQYSKTECAHFEHISKPKRISEQIAKELGVGKETIKRAEKFSKGVDAVKAESPGGAAEYRTHRRSAGRTRKPLPLVFVSKVFFRADSPISSFCRTTVHRRGKTLRAYILVKNRAQLFSVFPKGTPVYEEPEEALEAARGSGAAYIIMWARTYTPLVEDGRTLIDLDGKRSGRVYRTDNVKLALLCGQKILRAVDPDLPV